MNFVKQVLLIMVVGALLQSWLSWWVLIFPAFLTGFKLAKSGGEAFLSAFVATGLLWLGMSLYIDATTGSMLSQKIATLFPGKSVLILQSLTILVGGLTGGFAALTGYSLKNLR
jgi:hypothetical protein